MQLRPIRCLQPADLGHDITTYALRSHPVEPVGTARDDVFRRLVERLRDRVLLVRPVGGEELVGPASQKHVELGGDSLVHNLHQSIVPEGHGPASVGEPIPRILLGAAGPLHDAIHGDLGDRDDLSHDFSPVFSRSYTYDERPALLSTQSYEHFYRAGGIFYSKPRRSLALLTWLPRCPCCYRPRRRPRPSHQASALLPPL